MKKFTLLTLFLCILSSLVVVKANNSDRKIKKTILSGITQTKISNNKYLLISEKNETTNILLSEDFNKFTAGTEENPDQTEISDYETGEIPAKYTQDFGWRGAGIFQAGGCCYIDLVEYEETGMDTGLLDTKYLDLSKDGGIFSVKFRIRSQSKEGDEFSILSYNINNTYIKKDIEITNEWTEHTINFDNGADGILIEFYAGSFPCFIDDIEISQASSTIHAPVAKPASNVSDEKFTANWEAVEGATSYLLNVYSYEESTKKYLLQDEEIEDTKCTVENLTKGIQYYYTVRATDGENISAESNEIKVEPEEIGEVKAAKLLPATNVTEKGFTANWESVKATNSYWFYLFETYTAKGEETYTIIDEDFEKITQGNFNSPVIGGMEEYLDEYTDIPGWEAVFPLFAKGMVGVSADMGLFKSTLASPRFDLSSNDGKFTVELSGVASTGNSLNIYKESSEAHTTEPVDKKTVTFESDNQIFKIDLHHENPYAIGGINLLFDTDNKKVFIDNIKITKELRTGDEFSYLTYAVLPMTGKDVESVDVEVVQEPGFKYGYGIVTLKPAGDSELEFLGFENRMYVDMPNTGIKSTSAEPYNAYVKNGNLYVILQENIPISIYSIAGIQVTSIQGNIGENIIPLSEKGVYIVKTGNRAFKIIR